MITRAFTLDDLIDGETETIMYTCAPSAVKSEAVKLRRELIAQRDAARARSPGALASADPYCRHCGGFGRLVFSADESAWPTCRCCPRADAPDPKREGETQQKETAA